MLSRRYVREILPAKGNKPPKGFDPKRFFKLAAENGYRTDDFASHQEIIKYLENAKAKGSTVFGMVPHSFGLTGWVFHAKTKSDARLLAIRVSAMEKSAKRSGFAMKKIDEAIRELKP